MKANPNKNHDCRATSIEREINAIFQHISESVHEGLMVRMEPPSKGMCCKGAINIFRCEDVKEETRQTASYFDAIKNGADKALLKKPVKAKPVLKLSFYPSVYNPQRLGSIAIYGEFSMCFYRIIKDGNTLFGYKVKESGIEMGLRPFVNVKLASYRG